MIVPVNGTPIRNGAILVDTRGRIRALGPRDTVPKSHEGPQLHYPGAAVIPGLVNAHTHLELTHFGGPLEAATFYDWLQLIRQGVDTRSPADMLESARAGVRDTWRHGTTTVADTGGSGTVAVALAELGARGIAYQEVFGPDPSAAHQAMADLRARMMALGPYASERVTLGVSPHAPYTVSRPLFERVVRYAADKGFPVAVHLAESQAETDLIVHNTGPFASSFAGRGISLPQATGSPVGYLHSCGVLNSHLLAIHCVQTDQADRAILAACGTAVATCPTSNRMHGHGEPPLQGFLEAGIRIGVGTDSVASVGSVDLLREARAVRDSLALTPEMALRTITLGAARALNLHAEVGSLDVGKWADLAVIALDDADHLVEDQILEATASEIQATFVAGRCVHGQRGMRE